jgi:hypothetical protein
LLGKFSNLQVLSPFCIFSSSLPSFFSIVCVMIISCKGLSCVS